MLIEKSLELELGVARPRDDDVAVGLERAGDPLIEFGIFRDQAARFPSGSQVVHSLQRGVRRNIDPVALVTG